MGILFWQPGVIMKKETQLLWFILALVVVYFAI